MKFKMQYAAQNNTNPGRLQFICSLLS